MSKEPPDVPGRKTAQGGIHPYHVVLFTLWILVAGYFLAQGWSYYRLPLQERPFAEGYDTFKPGGSVGLNLGTLGTLLMVIGVLTYSVRKRVRRFNKLGRLRNWLSFHIFVCSLGPFLVLLHTSFKVNGIVAISFLSMVIVVLSGITGRFLYVRIPRSINGQVRSLLALHEEREALLSKIQAESHLPADAMASLFPPIEHRRIRGFGPAVRAAFEYALDKRNRKKWIVEKAREFSVAPELQNAFVDSYREQVRLERHIVLLTPFQKLFRHWITMHVPLTIIMGIIVLLHIGVAIAFGYVLDF